MSCDLDRAPLGLDRRPGDGLCGGRCCDALDPVPDEAPPDDPLPVPPLVAARPCPRRDAEWCCVAASGPEVEVW